MDELNEIKICPICREEIDYYSYGTCDHPTCASCAVKVRKFGSADEPDFSKCATCRSLLNRVVIMTKFKPFSDVNLSVLRHEMEYDFLFENEDVEAHYKKLIVCECRTCGHVAPSMSSLNRHTTMNHGVSYCALCLRHARLLPCEFTPMTPAEFVDHCKWDKSKKRGHPKCDFCGDKFYELEDLMKHIRDRHFLCDFCHVTGSFEVFLQQKELLDHYRHSHFLCPECDIRGRMTCFASRDQLGLHRLHEHPTESTNDPNRWDPVQIRYTTQGLFNQHGRVDMPHGPAGRLRRQPQNPPTVDASPQVVVEHRPEQWTGVDFPTLAGPSPSKPTPTCTEQNSQPCVGHTRSLASVVGCGGSLSATFDDFPSLPSTADSRSSTTPIALKQWTAKQQNGQRRQQPVPSLGSVKQIPPNPDDFPGLGAASASNNEGSLNWGKQPAQNSMPPTSACFTAQKCIPQMSDFPSLSAENDSSKKAAASSLFMQPALPSLNSNAMAKLLQRTDTSQANQTPASDSKKKKKQTTNQKEQPKNSVPTIPRFSPREPSSGSSAVLMDEWSSPARDEAALIETLNHIQTASIDQMRPNVPRTSQTAPEFSTSNFPTLGAVGTRNPKSEKPVAQKKPAKASPSKKQNGSATKANAPTPSGELKDLVETETLLFEGVAYTPPVDTVALNHNLIQLVETRLSESSTVKSAFSRFTEISRLYRYGQLTADAYLQGLDGLVGTGDHGSWLAEMISLLPDVGLQRALLRALKGEAAPRVPNFAVPKRALAKPAPTWAKDVVSRLQICNICGQVCLRSSLKEHIKLAHS